MSSELERRRAALLKELRALEAKLEGCRSRTFAGHPPAEWRKRIQATPEALERSLLQSLVEHAPDNVLVVDREHRALFSNHLRGGWHADEIIGRKVEELVPEEFRPRVHDAIEHVFETAEASAYESRIDLPKGTFWYSVHVGPVFRENRVEHVSLISRDISDRVRESELHAHERDSLARSEARFRTLVEYAPEAMVILDVDTGCFVDANANACRLFGRSREELLELGPTDVSPELQPDGTPSRDASLRRIREALDGKHSVFEWAHCDASGAVILCEARLVRLPHEYSRWVRGSLIDITERKQAEAERARLTVELAQAQKMQAIGQLTGGVAHDFNNLLTIIMSNLTLIDAQAEQTDAVRAHAEEAMTASERAAALTQRLLAFARRQPLRPRTVDVNELIAGTEALLRRTLGERITIETHLDEGLWVCETDPAQLENVILNLAINARDAMSEGGKLTIETANANLDRTYVQANDKTQPGAYVMLAVTDDGTGMPPEVLSQVFEPFYTTKGVGHGSGLGLSMVYGFVKQSGGHIKIDSRVGEGTTVRIYLPRSTATARGGGPTTRRTSEPRGDADLVLVVEDEAAVRGLVVKSLRRLGYRTLDAPNTDVAFEILQSTSDVTLLLADVVLPGKMNGEQLARRARELRPALPVLFMSGYTEDAVVHQDRLQPGVTLLEKPFTHRELAMAVQEAIDAGPAGRTPPVSPGSDSPGSSEPG